MSWSDVFPILTEEMLDTFLQLGQSPLHHGAAIIPDVFCLSAELDEDDFLSPAVG